MFESNAVVSDKHHRERVTDSGWVGVLKLKICDAGGWQPSDIFSEVMNYRNKLGHDKAVFVTFTRSKLKLL